MSDHSKPSKYRETIKFSTSSVKVRRGRTNCHEEVNMVLPNRWVVKGLDKNGKEFIFPIRSDAQQTKENADDMCKNMKRKGGNYYVYEEYWCPVENYYKRIDKNG